MNEILKFQKIDMSSISEVWRYISKDKGRSCDYSYGGIFMWVDYFNYEYSIFKDTLFIKGLVADNRTREAFSVPIGSMSIEESLKILKNYCTEKDEELIFSAVPEYFLYLFKDLNSRGITELIGWGDYLYSAESLAYLRGRKMSKKRNHVNKHYLKYKDSIYEQLSRDNIDEVKAFMNDFELEDCSSSMAQTEKNLVLSMLDTIFVGENPLIGGVVRVNGNVEAFTIGDIKGDTLFVHIEKANRKIEGIYEVINKRFAEDILSRYPDIKYINREDDAGEEGLRKAKLSYHPITILKKFNVIF